MTSGSNIAGLSDRRSRRGAAPPPLHPAAFWKRPTKYGTFWTAPRVTEWKTSRRSSSRNTKQLLNKIFRYSGRDISPLQIPKDPLNTGAPSGACRSSRSSSRNKNKSLTKFLEISGWSQEDTAGLRPCPPPLFQKVPYLTRFLKSPSRHGMKNLQEMLWIHGVSARSSSRNKNNSLTIFLETS